MLLYNPLSSMTDNNNNYIYSVDMLRVNGTVSLDIIENFRSFFQARMNTDSRFEYTHMIKYAKYEHLWKINCKSGTSISIGAFLRFNVSASDSSRRTCFIEFNPNKLEFSEFLLIDEILLFLSDVSVVRLDLAIDIPDCRQFYHIVPDMRKYSTELYQGSFTEYLGRHNSVDFVKLYDKQKESKLEYSLTRLEVTCEPYISSFRDCVPVVLCDNTQFNLLLDLEELPNMARELVLYARRFGNPDYNKSVLKRLDYKTRKKLEPFMFGDCRELAFNENIIQQLFTWCKVCCTNRHFATDSI